MTPICLIETTKADYRLPLWASDRTASMAHVDCSYPWGTDPTVPLDAQMTGIVQHLLSTPEHLRSVYLYALGVNMVKPYWGSPGIDWTLGKQPDPAIGLRQVTYVAEQLALFGIKPVLIFTDYEEPHMTKTGGYDKQSKRTAYLRAMLKPFAGTPRVNTNFVRFRSSDPVLDCFGNPAQSGTIDQTSALTCYSKSRDEWGADRLNVHRCTGPVMPHLPPVWEGNGQTPAEALQQLRDAVLWDAARGCTTFLMASYMFNRYHNSDDCWPRMMLTLTNALADAARATSEEANV